MCVICCQQFCIVQLYFGEGVEFVEYQFDMFVCQQGGCCGKCCVILLVGQFDLLYFGFVQFDIGIGDDFGSYQIGLCVVWYGCV